jgi:uncharacterized protein
MEIKHEQQGGRGAFYIDENGERLGEMIYNLEAKNKITIEHTEVSEKLKGKGAGKQLLASAVEHARKTNMKIIPMCHFAKSVMDRVKEYHDVLDS